MDAAPDLISFSGGDITFQFAVPAEVRDMNRIASTCLSKVGQQRRRVLRLWHTTGKMRAGSRWICKRSRSKPNRHSQGECHPLQRLRGSVRALPSTWQPPTDTHLARRSRGKSVMKKDLPTTCQLQGSYASS